MNRPFDIGEIVRAQAVLSARDMDQPAPPGGTGRPSAPPARPIWGTPTVIEAGDHTEIVTNGSRLIRGYNAETGKELWHLGPISEVTVARRWWDTGWSS